ncbi:unnamed protein product [Orchesella dallaii]|uniref:Dipeptidase n=1 Tax=Orchesella dallaii TaxID=48710 RepID=A0ABP1Q2Z6_9HEXA
MMMAAFQQDTFYSKASCLTSAITKTMSGFLFLILIVSIQPISLLKLSHSPPNLREGNKEISHHPDVTTATAFADDAQKHYSPQRVLNKEKSGKTNSFNIVKKSVQFEGNESDRRNDNEDDDDGRQFFGRTKTTTTSHSTFDLHKGYTLSRKRSSKRATRSLKRSTANATALDFDAASAVARKVESKENPEYGLGGGGSSEKKNTEKNSKTEEATENFQKSFVNGIDISVSDAVAFAGLDMGMVEKFDKGKSRSKEGKSGDKKSIQKDVQLSPSEELRNNDIKMQEFEQHLTNVKGKDDDDHDDVIASAPAATSSKGIIMMMRTSREADEEKIEIVNRKEEEEAMEKFEESVEEAPETNDSLENSSPFDYASSFNNNNVHEQRGLLNQSSRLTFANFADIDKVGSGTGNNVVGGGGGGGSLVEDAAASSTSAADEVKLYRLVQRLLNESPLIDGHNDLPWNLKKFLHGQLTEFRFDSNLQSQEPWSKSAWSHTDLPRLRRGLVGAQFWVAYAPCEAKDLNAVQITLEQIDLIRRLIARYPESLTLALSADDIEKAHEAGKIASLIAVEGGHSIGSSLATLRSFYELGVRYMTLTHTCNTPWADAAAKPGEKPQHGGLTQFGRAVVLEMNRLGMLVDLSHTSQLTMKDALKVSKAPVIFSHSSAYALCNSSRNVPDDILKELVWNRGIIMVTFYNYFVKCDKEATVRDVADHINYIRGKIGIQHIGIGSDFDGINLTPVGLEDVSKFPKLFVELARNPNWSNEELKMVAGKNFLRVMREAENIRDGMQSIGVVASFEHIPQHLAEANRCRHNTTTSSSGSIH